MSTDRIAVDVTANVTPKFTSPFPPRDGYAADMDIRPMLDKRLVTDAGQWKRPLSADIELNSAKLQRQLADVEKQLRAAHATLDLNLNVKSNDIKALVDRLQKELAKSDISLFNKDTKISPEHVREYMTRFVKEIKKVMNANADKFSLDFKSDLSSLEEQLLRFRAKMNLNMPVELDIEKLKTQFTDLVQNLETEIKQILPGALDSFFDSFETQTRKLPDTFNASVNEMRKNIEGLAESMQSAQVPVDAIAQLEKGFNELALRLGTIPINAVLSASSINEIQNLLNSLNVDLQFLDIANINDFITALDDIRSKANDVSKILSDAFDIETPDQIKDAFEAVLETVNKIAAAIESWGVISLPRAVETPSDAPITESTQSQQNTPMLPLDGLEAAIGQTVTKFEELDKELEQKVEDFKNLDIAIRKTTKELEKINAPASTPSTPPLPFQIPPITVNVDTAALATALAGALLKVNVIEFLGEKTVGAGWNAVGGGGGGSGGGNGGGSGGGGALDPITSIYDDMSAWTRDFSLAGRGFTNWLEILTGHLRDTDTAFASLSSGMDVDMLSEVFNALRNVDFSTLGSNPNQQASVESTVEKIMQLHGQTPNSTDRDNIISVVERLMTDARSESQRGASALTDMTNLIKEFGDARIELKDLEQERSTMNTDDPRWNDVNQQIRDLAAAIQVQVSAVQSAGFRSVVEFEDQEKYVQRETAERRAQGHTVTDTDIQAMKDDWVTMAETVKTAMQGALPDLQQIRDTVAVTLDDLKDPERWRGITDALEQSLGQAQKMAKDFAGVLDDMGFSDASRALNGVTNQIQSSIGVAQKMQGMSKQMTGWADAASKAAGQASGGTTKALNILSGALRGIGVVASKAALPLAAAIPLIKGLADAYNQTLLASANKIKGNQLRQDDLLQERILTSANTAKVTQVRNERDAQNSVKEWEYTQQIYNLRFEQLGAEVALTEALLDIEIERERAAANVAVLLQGIENSQTEAAQQMKSTLDQRARFHQVERSDGMFGDAIRRGDGTNEYTATNNGSMAASALGGAATGALVGAAVGSFIPVIGTAIGAIAGGLLGAAGGMMADAARQEASTEGLRRGEMSINQALDQSWSMTGAGDESLRLQYNANMARESQELQARANDHLTRFNSELSSTVQGLQAWGQYLSPEKLKDFEEAVEKAAQANKEAALVAGQLDRAKELQGLSGDALKQQVAITNEGWLWNTYSYTAPDGKVFKDEASFTEYMKEYTENLEEKMKEAEAERQKEKENLSLVNTMSQITAGYEKGAQDAASQRLKTMQDTAATWRREMSNFTSLQQMSTDARLNPMRANLASEQQERRARITRELAEASKREAEAENKRLERAGVSVPEREQKMKEWNERRQAEDAARIESDVARQELQENFNMSIATKRTQLEEQLAQKRRDFHLQEHDARMKDSIAFYQKQSDLDVQNHQARLQRVEEFAQKSKQAVETYAQARLETFASGRGANPLEDTKRIELARMQMENEQQVAQRRMAQEEKLQNMRSRNEMEMEAKKMEVAARVRDIEFRYQNALETWKLEMEINIARQVHNEQMELLPKRLAYEAALTKAMNLENTLGRENTQTITAHAKAADLKSEIMLEPSAPHAIDLDKWSQDVQGVHKRGADEMKNMQLANANALHSTNMQNIDTEHKHSLGYMLERARKERELNKEIYADKFRADTVNRQTQAESTQRSTDTSFATSMFGAKSGQDRMNAAAQYQVDTQFNAQKAQLEQKHAEETERLEQQGATEEQKARLKQQQERETGGLDQEKAFRDAMVSALGATGTLRDVAKEQGVGQKSSLEEAHERMKASAFGHIKDPAADAVTRMAREQQMQHQQLMMFLTMNMPHIINGLQKQGNAMTMSTINNFNEMGLGAGPL